MSHRGIFNKTHLSLYYHSEFNKKSRAIVPWFPGVLFLLIHDSRSIPRLFDVFLEPFFVAGKQTRTRTRGRLKDGSKREMAPTGTVVPCHLK